MSRIVLQEKLNDLCRQKTLLMSQRLELLTAKMEKTKDEIVVALDEAVQQMCFAANTALDAAVAGLEKMDEDGYRSVADLLQRIESLLSKAEEAQRVRTRLEGSTNMRTLLGIKTAFQCFMREAKLFGNILKNLKPMGVTRMEVSGRFNKIKQHLDDFSLIIHDGVVLPLQTPSYNGNRESGSRSLIDVVDTDTAVAASPVRLYLSGLRGGHTADQLRQYFAQYGVVTKCCIWRDFTTHKSKRCGFVTFKEMVCASRALADRPHYVNGDPVKLAPFISKKKNESPVSPLPMNEANRIGTITSHQVVVDGLPPAPNVNDIRSLFGKFGEIISVRVDEDLHRAFVAFSTTKALRGAAAAAPPRLKGMTLRVSLPEIPGLRPLGRLEEGNRVRACKKTELMSAGPLRLNGTSIPIAIPEDNESRPGDKSQVPRNSLAGHLSFPDSRDRHPCVGDSGTGSKVKSKGKISGNFSSNCGSSQDGGIPVESNGSTVPAPKIEDKRWHTGGGCVLQ